MHMKNLTSLIQFYFNVCFNFLNMHSEFLFCGLCMEILIKSFVVVNII